ASFISGGRVEVAIRQRWKAGEKWWEEYERYVNGRKELVARRIPPPPSTTLPKDTKSAGGPTQHGKSPTGRYALRSDPRLQVVLRLEGDAPDLTVVLEQLQKSTGLIFQLGPGLERHRPSLGSVQMAKAPAWTVMEMIAAQQLEDGRWERTPGGYR